MPFRIPTFNLQAALWSGNPPGPYPPAGAPRTTVACQLAPGKEVVQSSVPAARPSSLIRVAAATDIRGSISATQGDVIEVPVGSGNWYNCATVLDVARGFPNEYRFAYIFLAQVNTPMT